MKPAVNSLTVTFEVTVAVRETAVESFVRKGRDIWEDSTESQYPVRMFLCDVNVAGQSGQVQLGFNLDGGSEWEDWTETDCWVAMRDHLAGEIVKVIMKHHWKDPLEVLSEAEV